MTQLRILLVEDETDVIELFCQVFWKTRFGKDLNDKHEIVLNVAQTYEDAVAKLSNHTDIVFLDNNIPQRFYGEEIIPLGYTLLGSDALKRSIIIGTSSNAKANKIAGLSLIWNKHASNADEDLMKLLTFCCDKLTARDTP